MKQLKITKFPALDYAGNEAFNTLSTNLSFAGASVKKIMITSCHAAEGKSYLSMNLMRTLAQRVEVSGETVFLYTQDARPLLQALAARPHLRTLHRPANLEDLFLKLTGRQIREDG